MGKLQGLRIQTMRAGVIAVATFCIAGAFLKAAYFAPPAANLDQVRNGSAASPVSPGNWVNGNAGSSQAHYVEGFSVPYRVVFTDLPLATPISITIAYDIKHSDRHAIDFLTHYDRLEPHAPTFGHSAETIDPLIGVSGVSMTVDTFPIPVPDTTNSPVPGQPATTFNMLPAGERVMTLFGGDITAVAYVVNGDLTASQDETQISVTFTVDSATAVLAWGGHIGSRIDWGFDGGEPRSAGGISGSPYHMRLISWTLGNLGQQDRSLSAGAVADLCEGIVCPGPTGPCDAGQACHPATGGCVDLMDPAAGTGCEADGSLCTTDECDGMGSCVMVSSVSCPGPTGECDGGTVCDPDTGGCVPAADPPLSTPCEADGDLCTDDHCDGMGSCVFLSDVTCPMPGQCETLACNPATGVCDSTPRPLSTPCEADGSLCTTDHCDGMGACVLLDVTECQPGNPPCDAGQLCNPATGLCETQPDAPLSTPCERDGNLCTIDHCNGAGLCVTFDNVMCSGSGNPCDAGEQCNPSTGMCENVLDPPSGTPCEADGDLCTIDECDGAGNCVFDHDFACPAGDQCNDIVCDPGTGNCVSVPKPFSTNCEADGDLCTNDHCDGMGNCVLLDRVACADPGQCENAACNPATGLCDITPEPLSTPCEADGDLCTNDHCDGAGDCVLLNIVTCQDPTQCDGGSSCNPMTGGCVANPDPPLSTPCEADGNLCTNDHCDGMGSCVLLSTNKCTPPAGECDGGSVCVPSTGLCMDVADDPLSTPCEADGDLCTIDHCDGMGSCVFLSDVDCSGLNDQCNDGVCDPQTGDCDTTPKPFSTECDRDANPCTIDHCDGTGNCVQLDVIDCPTITCPGNLVFECDNVGDFGEPTFGDCEIGYTYECTEQSQPGKLPQEQTITRTCTVTNECGQQSSCEQIIEIVDTTPPVITCPPDLQFECDNIGDFGEPTVEDNCDPDPDVTVEVEVIINDCTPAVVAGISPPPKEIIVRTFTATDGTSTFVVAATGGTGNVAQCTQTIEIFDSSPPTMGPCPGDQDICEGAALEFIPPTCNDTCGACVVTCTRSDGEPLDAPVIAPITVTCVAEDVCLNASIPCEFTVDTHFCLIPIPTISEWGLVVLALMLLIGGKLYTQRRAFA